MKFINAEHTVVEILTLDSEGNVISTEQTLLSTLLPLTEEALAAIEPYTAPVPSAADIRSERNALLSKTDWTQLPDVSEQTRAAWTAYRQALRDVTNQPGFPGAVVWPVKPE